MKLALIYILRFVLKAFYVFPIKKNRIVFCSYQGVSYNCNPKYIYKFLSEKYGKEFEYIWVINDRSKSYPFKTIPIHSLKYVYVALTAKIYISNTGISSYLPKRRDQVVINTWHGGGAYKKVSIDVFNDHTNLKIAEIVGKETDYYISSCKKFSEIMSKATLVPAKNFIECGMPRNDIFFKHDKKKIVKKVKTALGITEEEKTVLFAPTFRDSNRVIPEEINVTIVLSSLNEKFGGHWKFLARTHCFGNQRLTSSCLDVTAYADMQELLVMADVLITDYSSCMWDFSFTYKPCFIFAPDVSKYEQERDFYTPMAEWPYPLAYNNEQLKTNIMNFNQTSYTKMIEAHHMALGSCENGTASQTLSKIITKEGRV